MFLIALKNSCRQKPFAAIRQRYKKNAKYHPFPKAGTRFTPQENKQSSFEISLVFQYLDQTPFHRNETAE